MKRVLLSGGTGFVGANLTRRLLADGYEVQLVVRPSHATWRIQGILEHVQLHEVDLADAEQLRRVVAAIRPEYVFHLAAHGAYPAQTDLAAMIRTNILGTANLVLACLQVGFDAFVNTGSSSEYGFKDHPSSETEPLEPNSHYAVTKASATLFCRYAARKERVHLPTLRLYSVYGPYEEPSRLLPTLIAHGLRGELPPLAAPDVARDYVYVDDVCDAYLLAAERPGGEFGAVYNVGTGIQTTLSEIVTLARSVLPITAQPRWGALAAREWDTNTWAADIREIREKLGWQPCYNLARGFRKMVHWLSDHETVT